jgi:hypothetical protein
MTDRQPAEVTNPRRYANPVLPWSRPHDLLASGPDGPGAGFFPGTVRAGRGPHAARIGAVWHDGDRYFTSGPRTRKARNLAPDPACAISVQLPGLDLTLDGQAERVAQPAILERVADIYRDIGRPAEVTGDGYSAPGAGPPPWHRYRFTFRTRRRPEHHRAGRRDTLAVRPITTPRSPEGVDVEDVMKMANATSASDG